MPYVPKELIETTWRAVGASTGHKIQRLQKNHKKAQNSLTKFVYANCVGLREEAASVGIYVYHVIIEAFSKARPRPGSIRRAQIERVLSHQNQLKSFDQEKAIEESSEPHILRYVYEALSEDEDDVVLSENEREHIFGILHAVIMCLNDSCEASKGRAR